MFVCSVKTSYKQVLSVLGCVAVLVVAVVLSAVLPHDTAVASASVSDSAAREEYLRSLGYEVEDQSEEVREVRIPDEADEALAQYNTLLEAAGRSLKPYFGKRVRLYTYTVTDADGAQKQANLYVYRDRLIAADVDGTVL